MLEVIFLVLVVVSCPFTEGAAAPPQSPHLPVKVYDLSHGYDEKTLSWITSQSFEFTKKEEKTLNDGTWYAANEFKTAEHSGTHLDAPYHFSRIGWKVGDIPLNNFIAQGVFLDVTSEVRSNADFEVMPHHLQQWEKKNGPLPQRSVLLIKTGWSARYPNKGMYFGTTTNETSKLHFPGISLELARELARRKELVGVGLDTPSLDAGKTGKYSSHVAILGANIYALENLKLHHATDLPARGFVVYVMPMKIHEGTGAPCRVVAVMDPCKSGSSPTATNVYLTTLLLSIATAVLK